MGLRSLIGLFSVALAFSLVACDSDKAQKIEPQTRGKRGERCQARNDCDDGLACIGGLCAKNEFDIDVSVKHCERVECSNDEDCCGERPTAAPPKCKDREWICNTPTLPNCVQTTCTAAGECPNGGTCAGVGTCSYPGGTCTDVAQCLDVCGVSGVCTRSGVTCIADTDCTYYSYNATASCSGRVCNCANPEYDSLDPLCTDEACVNVCTLRCQDRLCLQDDSCELDSDCPNTEPFCDGGRCVQCTHDSECNEDNDETCERGRCHRPCEFNEECGLFEECQSGDCVYVGCKSSRECILASARGQNGVGGSASLVGGAGDDARLAECLRSEVDKSIGVCRIPCENDGNCGQFEVCEDGYCKFIGCNNDDECRAYLGIANQVVSEEKPYVATAECTDAPASAD